MKRMINLLFSRGGRISRREYFAGLIIGSMLISLLLGIIFLLMSFVFNQMPMLSIIVSIVIGSIAWLLSIYVTINLIVKRIHDFGQGGGNIFLLMIPLFNIYYGIKLLVQKGEPNDNRFGTSRLKEKKMSLLLPIIIAVVAYGIIVGIQIYWMGGMIKEINNGEDIYHVMSKNPIMAKILDVIGGIIKNTEAYQVSLQAISANSEIMDIYGKFEVGPLPMGSISTEGLNGLASLQISLSGEKDSGVIYVDLQKQYGKWNIINMVSVDAQDNQKYIIGSGAAISQNTMTSNITKTTTGTYTYTSASGFSLQYPSNRTVQENSKGGEVTFLAPFDENNTSRSSISVIAVALMES